MESRCGRMQEAPCVPELLTVTGVSQLSQKSGTSLSFLFTEHWWASLVAQTVKCLQCVRPRFNLWVGKISWRRKWHPTPVLLPGKSLGWRSLVGCSPWGHKESVKTEQLTFTSQKIGSLNFCSLSKQTQWSGFTGVETQASSSRSHRERGRGKEKTESFNTVIHHTAKLHKNLF